jgi:phosphoglycolate phosphatase-like HAD superfamily hydrolase/pimeloyl-ACP methyl ester carboxylesterase
VHPSDHGHGIVLIHGLFSSGKTWSDIYARILEDSTINATPIQFEYWSPRFRINPMKQIPDFDTVARRLSTFITMETADYPTLTLVSHSQGGLVVQRFLEQTLSEGQAEILKRVAHIHLIACPNTGSELAHLFRRWFWIWRHPQERQLRPLNDAVKKSHNVVLKQVVNADEWSATKAPIPLTAYAGDSDGIVSVSSAQGYFPTVEVLPGDHFSVIAAKTADAPVYRAITGGLRSPKIFQRDQATKKVAPSAPRLPDQSVPVRRIRHNLTHRPSFVGRQSELDRVLEGLCSTSGIVSIVGLGGNGKTALARAVAWFIVNRSSIGHRFESVVWCGDTISPLTLDSVLDEIASTIEFPRIRPLRMPTKMHQTLDVLRARSVLLVIDEIERCVDDQLFNFLARFDTTLSRAITTSRESLTLDSWVVRLEGLRKADAMELIRAEAQRLDLPQLTDGQEHWASLMYEMTGGNAFAIKLSCGRLHSGRVGVQELIDEIRNAELSELSDPIFRKIWTEDLGADNDGKRIMTALSVHPGGVSANAIEAAVSAPPLKVREAFARLNAISLIDIDRSGTLGAVNRYGVHPLTAAFVRRVVLPEWQDELRGRFVDHYLRYAVEHGETYAAEKNIRALDAERGALIWFADLAYKRASATNAEADWQAVIGFARALAPFLWGRGLWRHRLRLCEHARNASLQIGDRLAAAIQSVLAGRVHLWLGDTEAALAELKRAKTFAPHGSTKRDKIPIQRLEAQLASARGDTLLAEELLNDILIEALDTVDDDGRAATLIELGVASARRGDHEAALPLFEEALSLDRAHMTVEGCAVSLSHLGNARIELGMVGPAEAAFTEGLDLALRADRMSAVGRCQHGLARVNGARKNYEIAFQFGRAAVDIFNRLGMKQMEDQASAMTHRLRTALTFSTQPAAPSDRFRAVVFDCDDTLLATARMRWGVLQQTAAEFGVKLTEQTIRSNWGKPFDKLIASLVPELDQEKFVRRYRQAMSDHPPGLTPGVRQVLELLKSHRIPMVVVTSSQRGVILQDLQVVQLDRFFSAIFGHEETIYHKPDPRVLDAPLDHLRSLEIAPRDTLYIGDSVRDFQAATGAGIAFLGVLTGIESAEDFKNAGLTDQLIVEDFLILL